MTAVPPVPAGQAAQWGGTVKVRTSPLLGHDQMRAGSGRIGRRLGRVAAIHGGEDRILDLLRRERRGGEKREDGKQREGGENDGDAR